MSPWARPSYSHTQHTPKHHEHGYRLGRRSDLQPSGLLRRTCPVSCARSIRPRWGPVFVLPFSRRATPYQLLDTDDGRHIFRNEKKKTPFRNASVPENDDCVTPEFESCVTTAHSGVEFRGSSIYDTRLTARLSPSAAFWPTSQCTWCSDSTGANSSAILRHSSLPGLTKNDYPVAPRILHSSSPVERPKLVIYHLDKRNVVVVVIYCHPR